MSSLHTLLPDGDYEIHRDLGAALAQAIEGAEAAAFTPAAPRRRGVAAGGAGGARAARDPPRREPRDAACPPGTGRATAPMNGKILYSGMCRARLRAAGGARRWLRARGGAADSRLERLLASADQHLLLGSRRAARPRSSASSSAWSRFSGHERAEDLAGRVADVIAAGAAVGWAQGGSSSVAGLGCRSILADPRPAANKDPRERDGQEAQRRYRPLSAPGRPRGGRARVLRAPAR